MADSGKVPPELLRVAVEQIDAIRRGVRPKDLYRLGDGYWMQILLVDIEQLEIIIYHELEEMLPPAIENLQIRSRWFGNKHQFSADDFVNFLRAAIYPYHQQPLPQVIAFDQW